MVRRTFGAASFVAVILGAAIAHGAGVAAPVWARNVVAWLVGAWLAGAIGGRPSRRAGSGVLLAAIGALALTLVAPGMAGIHRWVALGPVRMNAAMLVLPAAVVTLARVQRPLLFALPVGALLVAQPDASQMTAFAAAAIVALRTSLSRRELAALGGVLALLVAASWWRPDPLAPVPEVEGILALAARQSLALTLAATIALGLAVLAPVLVHRQAPAAQALTAYMALTALAPAAGAFPVPLLGMSMSPILGGWLAVALLDRTADACAPPR